MSHENVRVMRDAYAAMAREGPDAILPYLHEDVEWAQWDAEGSVQRGREAVAVARRRWWDEWHEYVVEAERFLDAGDDVLVVTRERGLARHSGVKIEGRFFNVFTIKERRILRFREYRDEAEALRSVVLRE